MELETPRRHSAPPAPFDPVPAGLWSEHAISQGSVSPEVLKAWAVLQDPRSLVPGRPTPCGRLFFIASDSWTLYSISLADVLATPGRLLRAPFSGLPRDLNTPAVTHPAGKFLLLLSDDYRTLYWLRLDTGEWKSISIGGQCPKHQHKATMIVCGNYLYVFGGRFGNLLAKKEDHDIWRLDISTCSPTTWGEMKLSSHSEIPQGRVLSHLVSGNGKIYMHGGYTRDVRLTELTDTWEFDPVQGTWSEILCTGAAPSAASATLVGTTILVNKAGQGGMAALNVKGHGGILPRWSDLQSTSQSWGACKLMIRHGSQIYFLHFNLQAKDGSGMLQVLHAGHLVGPVSGKVHPQAPVLNHIKATIHAEAFHLIETPKKLPGCGGFCDIYISRHTPTKTKLAMKCPRLNEDCAMVIKRFHREAKIWATFNHPNVLPFLGTMEKDQDLFLISPWMKEGDLTTFMRRHSQPQRSLTLPVYSGAEQCTGHHLAFDRRKIIFDVASGISYLHTLNFVHGDIKGKNILIADDGHAVLCDFGMTKALDGTSAVTSTTMKGVGTLRWQSPELFENETKSLKSDVYAFAMTIVEILTGDQPLPHLNDWAFMSGVIHKNERPAFCPTSRRGTDFLPLWKIAAKCWAKDPKERLSMDEVLLELEASQGPAN